tara:strand:+ start:78 stop:314 length:237 start_codon:yes stop_codon:yes gene_type:complete
MEITHSTLEENILQEFTKDYLEKHKELIEFVKKETIKQLTLTDVVSTFICDTCKDKGSIAYWHKTGMGIKPCKCRKTN